MTATTVVHVKAGYDVLIDRTTRWGNPFFVGVHGSRAQVLSMYRNHILASPDLLADLESLRGKRIGCWCRPRGCHGDVLVQLLKELCPVCGQHAKGRHAKPFTSGPPGSDAECSGGPPPDDWASLRRQAEAERRQRR